MFGRKSGGVFSAPGKEQCYFSPAPSLPPCHSDSREMKKKEPQAQQLHASSRGTCRNWVLKWLSFRSDCSQAGLDENPGNPMGGGWGRSPSLPHHLVLQWCQSLDQTLLSTPTVQTFQFVCSPKQEKFFFVSCAYQGKISVHLCSQFFCVHLCPPEMLVFS